MNAKQGKILFVMGVSGAGKSTVGRMLSQELSLPFFDGDDFHPPENIAKMANGTPLTDADRKTWLLDLNELAQKEQKTGGCIIACSALKITYRKILTENMEDHCTWIFLKGSFDQIAKRLQKRKDHFMTDALLQSQFDALEEPKEAIHIDIDLTPTDIINLVKAAC